MKHLVTACLFLALIGSHARAQLVARGPWTGALGSDSVVVSLELFEARLTSLEVSTEVDFTRRISVPEQPRPEGWPPTLTRYVVRNLQPNTFYYFRVKAGNLRESQRIGTFTTAPLENSPASFRFAIGAGATSTSEAGSFSEVRYQEPLFFIHLGNLHDETLSGPATEPYREAYQRALDSFTQAELYRAVPVVYTWHTFDAPPPTGRAAARLVYDQMVPHYPLAADTASEFTSATRSTAPISHAFTVGRTRFLVLDTRLGRTAEDSMLGTWQLNWLKQELLAARDVYPVVFIASSAMWNASAPHDGETWADFPTERDALAQWIADEKLTGVILLTGNGGETALNDGTTSVGRLPEFSVGPFDLRTPPILGSWTSPPVQPSATEEFFGLVEVEDKRTSINVKLRGMNQNGRTTGEITINVPAPAPRPQS